jgi:hypothetical protein
MAKRSGSARIVSVKVCTAQNSDRDGDRADGAPRIGAGEKSPTKPRDVFVYFIHDGKIRAPAAAMALMERVTADAQPPATSR